MQARVFELVHQDGRPTGKVVKIAHTDLGHRTLNAVWISMEREWEVGLKLRVALQRPDGQLPGYMRVCDALVSADDGGKGGGGGKRHAARFAGMVVEKLNGEPSGAASLGGSTWLFCSAKPSPGLDLSLSFLFRMGGLQAHR
jgi:hypothetical protein